MSRIRGAVTRAVLAGAGALAARAALRAIQRSPAAVSLERTNHRGATVSLAAGPALAVAASTTAAAGAGSPALASAALVAGLGSGAVGLYDDVVGQRPEQRTAKGFRGHLSALAEGRVTSGLVKIAGIGASALVAAALVGRARAAARDGAAPGATEGPGMRSRRRGGAGAGRGSDLGGSRAGGRTRRRGGSGEAAGAADAVTGRPETTRGHRTASSGLGRATDLVIDTGLIAGAANLANLFDLRPGRALKVGLAVSGPLRGGRTDGLLAGPTGAGSALLRDDLDEQVMLGDSGANAWGALLGVAAACRGRTARLAMLAGIVGLTLASEKVSFTQVIESTPGLRDLDAWGRRSA